MGGKVFSIMQKFGIKIEDWFLNLAIEKGYKPKLTRWGAENCDMVIRGLPVEIKAARPTIRRRKGKKYTRWQWHIHPTSQQMQGDWVLVLVAQDENEERYLYILPGSVLAGRTHLQLTSHPLEYSGWISRWANKWELISYLGDQRYKNGGSLFLESEAQNG